MTTITTHIEPKSFSCVSTNWVRIEAGVVELRTIRCRRARWVRSSASARALLARGRSSGRRCVVGDVLLMTDTAASLRDTVSSFAPHLQILKLVDGVEFSEDQLETSPMHSSLPTAGLTEHSISQTCLAAPRPGGQSASAGGDHPVFGRFQDRGVGAVYAGRFGTIDRSDRHDDDARTGSRSSRTA